MKYLYLFILLLYFSVPVLGQKTGTNAPKPLLNNYSKSKVIVKMNDGKSIQGTLKNVVDPIQNYIQMTEDGTKKKLKLTFENIETITILPFNMKKSTIYSDTTVFSKVNIERELSGGRTEIVERLLRIDYLGKNVSLYSSFTGEIPYSPMPGGASAGQRDFFIKLSGESYARRILTENAGTKIAFGRAKQYANKFEDYPEIVERILNKEFEMKYGPYYIVVALDKYLDK